MITTKVTESIIYYTLYKPKEKIKCRLKTFYGHHKGGDFNYAYKQEITPFEETISNHEKSKRQSKRTI